MAYKMMLRGSQLPFIWNITQRVGSGSSGKNLPGDVELVKFLLHFNLSRSDPAWFQEVGGRVSGATPIKINSIFDVTVAFWIFSFQHGRRQAPGFSNSAVDGRISPATRYDRHAFAIADLNHSLYKLDRSLFNNLASSQQLTQNLRDELSVDMAV